MLEAEIADLEAACARGLAAARCPTARAAALASRSGGGFSLCVELAGDAPSVERDAAGLAAAPAQPEALDRVRELQGRERGLRFRLAVLPSRLPAVLARLEGAERLAYPGLGLVWAGFGLADGEARDAADAAWTAVASTAREAGGSFRLEAGPLFAKQGRDVFGDPNPADSLVRALKERFDPQRVLNPGRFAGGV